MLPVDEAITLGLSNPGLLAPLAALPIFTAGYVRYSISARLRGFNFQLRKLETVELDRSLLLYKKVSDRLHDIREEAENVEGTLLARYRLRKTLKQKFAHEREDLEQYAAHLRSTIFRLRGKPVQRFKSWGHIISAQFALGRSLVTYFAVCTAGLLALYGAEQGFLLHPIEMKFDMLPFWDWMPSPLLYANSALAGLLLVTTPVLYFYRRATLHRRHAAKLRSLKEFAEADPDSLIQRLRFNEEPRQEPSPEPEDPEETNCFTVLGVPPSATIEQVKDAYKLQVKQTHPDRVQDMSPVFRELAEAETKKLNAAYEEAVFALRGRERMPAQAMA